jgi:hypothetical protein
LYPRNLGVSPRAEIWTGLEVVPSCRGIVSLHFISISFAVVRVFPNLVILANLCQCVREARAYVLRACADGATYGYQRFEVERDDAAKILAYGALPA